MNRDWILQTKEARRAFADATWVPLRASHNDEQGEVRKVGYVSEYFGCGSVAFPPENREVAERLAGLISESVTTCSRTLTRMDTIRLSISISTTTRNPSESNLFSNIRNLSLVERSGF